MENPTVLVQKPVMLASFQEYMRKEAEYMLVGDNPWFAGIRVRHPPSHLDCLDQFEDSGAMARFRQEFTYPGRDDCVPGALSA